MGCPAGYLLRYLGRHFRRISSSQEVAQESIPVWKREKDGAMVLVGLSGHSEWVVGEFVVAVRAGVDEDRVRSGPLVSVDDRSQSPGSVRLVVDC